MLIYALLGKIQPKKVFIVLPAFYLLMNLLGVIIAVLLVLKYGPALGSQQIDMAFIYREFPWFNPAHQIIMAAWIIKEHRKQ